jgi:hypothetical protein
MTHTLFSTKAPVLVLVHTRFDHFKKCIESLLKCPESIETELFISADYYRNEDEKHKILKVRGYIKSIKGFKKVSPIYFDKNVGSKFASKYSINKVFEKYDSIIILEDDVEVSPWFLNYMNKGLDYYENDPNVFSICGFSPYVMTDNYNLYNKNNIFFNPSLAGWGVASWKEKFNKLLNLRINDQLLNIITNDLENEKFVESLNTLSPKYYIHFLYCIKKNKIPEFDFLAAYYCLKNNMYNVYSTKTFSKNYGHDGSGFRTLYDSHVTSRMDEANYADELPIYIDFNEVHVIKKLPLQHENNLQRFFKIIAIKLNIFDELKLVHRKIRSFVLKIKFHQ